MAVILAAVIGFIVGGVFGAMGLAVICIIVSKSEDK